MPRDSAPDHAAPLSPRRRQLLEAALHVIADEGLRGLTHRAVDRRAGLPRAAARRTAHPQRAAGGADRVRRRARCSPTSTSSPSGSARGRGRRATAGVDGRARPVPALAGPARAAGGPARAHDGGHPRPRAGPRCSPTHRARLVELVERDHDRRRQGARRRPGRGPGGVVRRHPARRAAQARPRAARRSWRGRWSCSAPRSPATPRRDGRLIRTRLGFGLPWPAAAPIPSIRSAHARGSHRFRRPLPHRPGQQGVADGASVPTT